MTIKRKLCEIIALYKFEPDLKDIYVEGCFDRHILEWFLSNNNVNNVRVYNIDQFEIPDEILLKYNLCVGSNRSRVIALSSELHFCISNKLSVLCLADRDFEDICPSVTSNNYLKLTDCNQLELYAYNVKSLNKFIKIALGGVSINASIMLGQLTSVLEQVFAIRATNEALKWGMEWLPFIGYVSVSKSEFKFNNSDFIKAYLLKNDRWQQRIDFEEKHKELVQKLPSDKGRKVRGHDFTELFLHVIRKLYKDRKFGNVETLEGCLMASLDNAYLVDQPLFKTILAATT